MVRQLAHSSDLPVMTLVLTIQAGADVAAILMAGRGEF